MVISKSRFAISAISIALACACVAAAPKPNNKGESTAYVLRYNVADLPVWEEKGSALEFAPQVLEALIESKVDPESWAKLPEIQRIPRSCALVIHQTQKNHESIAELLKSLRDNCACEVEEHITNH